MKATIYLADLRHNYSGVLANDCMPLGVAYLKAVMDRDLPDVESRLFAYPDRLSEALRQSPPDILMVSNYVWNEELSLRYLRLAKAVSPRTLTVMGGPNISIEDARQLDYVRTHPEIDVYILGEADFLATEVAKAFLDSGLSVEALRQRVLPSSVYRTPGGEPVINKMWDRHKEVDEVPSAWLTGIQDEFFDGKLAPMIETNRGCPFTCTFCVQGTGWYTKVHNFSKERIKEEIEYIAKRIKERSPSMGTLRIADSNYGMFERDVEISGYVGAMQREYGWPTFIDATTGKNRPERIIKSLEQVSGALVLYQAVQSLDESTLRNIKRSTIKLEAYEQIQIHVRGRGLRSNSDLILGLPGETIETHIKGIHQLIDAGTSEMHNFQSMLLKGAEMETLAARQEFKFESRFRVLPKNFGTYDGDRVFDMDEIVVSTDTLPFDDYLKCRKYHLVCSIFWNNSWFKDVVDCATRFGVKPSAWIDGVYAAMERDRGSLRALLDSFVDETTNELFPTREACIEFYAREENFERLRKGEIGDNLMYKYRAIASFQLWPHISRLALESTKEMILHQRHDLAESDFVALWSEFASYVELKHASGLTVETLLAPMQREFRFDIARWLEEGTPGDVEPYERSRPEAYEFALPAEAARELSDALKVWTTDLKGLSKLVTRIRPACQVRVCAPVHHAPPMTSAGPV